jgi:competence ComEA-like helix-hairpin-helix protein
MKMCIAYGLLFLYIAIPSYTFAAHGGGEKININTSDADTLKTLEGIGDTLANRIIDYRVVNGPFSTIQELIHPNIDRLYQSTFDKIKDHITVGDGAGTTTTNTDTTVGATEPPVINSIVTFRTVEVEPPQDIFLRVPDALESTAQAITSFEAEVYDARGRSLSDVDIMWSFGDGATARGRSVNHIFHYSGSYVVSVRARQGELFDEKTLRVQVYEPVLDVAIAPDGRWIEVANLGEYVIDLSTWRLHAGYQYFIIPERTRIQAGTSVRFDASVSGITMPLMDGKVFLRAPNSSVVVEGGIQEMPSVEEEALDELVAEDSPPTEQVHAQVGEENASSLHAASVSAPPSAARTVIGAVVPSASLIQSGESKDVANSGNNDGQITTEAGRGQIAASAAALNTGEPDTRAHTNSWVWYAAVGALAAISASAAVVVRRRARQMFTIEEVV